MGLVTLLGGGIAAPINSILLYSMESKMSTTFYEELRAGWLPARRFIAPFRSLAHDKGSRRRAQVVVNKEALVEAEIFLCRKGVLCLNGEP